MPTTQAPQLKNEAEKVKVLLTNFFNSMSAEDCSEVLNEMLQRYISPDSLETSSTLDIANRVHHVHTMNKLFRSLEVLKGELSC